FANAEVTYGQDKPVTVQNQLAALIQLRGLLPMCLSNTGGILWHEAGDE
ncbi:MAG TPA: alanine racemase, partial [Parasutterella excrementihominis]|nr:alanine racemase [Parasutterella excrementihominis]